MYEIYTIENCQYNRAKILQKQVDALTTSGYASRSDIPADLSAEAFCEGGSFHGDAKTRLIQKTLWNYENSTRLILRVFVCSYATPMRQELHQVFCKTPISRQKVARRLLEVLPKSNQC